MKIKLITAFFFSLSIMSIQAVVWNENVTEAEVIEMARPMTSVVLIKSGIGQGSGVLISDKHVLTAEHVIQQIKEDDNLYVVLEDEGGERYTHFIRGFHGLAPQYFCSNGQLILENPHEDIAIIELQTSVDTKRFPPASLYRGTPEDLCGELVYGGGYGCFASSSQETLNHPDGKRRYYETYLYNTSGKNCITAGTHDLSAIYKELEILENEPLDGWEHLTLGKMTMISAMSILLETLIWMNTCEVRSYKLLAQVLTRLAYYYSAHPSEPASGLVQLTESIYRIRNLLTRSLISDNQAINPSYNTKFFGNPGLGDSGSPLFKSNEVIGIIMAGSGGLNSSLKDMMAMGNPIYDYLPWIDEVLSGNTQPTHFYTKFYAEAKYEKAKQIDEENL